MRFESDSRFSSACKVEAPARVAGTPAGQLSRNAVTALPIYLRHALHTRTLPDHDRDPFDRILIAQALLEEIPLLSANPEIARYPVEVVW